MKKRIISTILVVVMLALALVGCGYSYIDDDLGQYVTFTKSDLDKALASLVIEDGHFGSAYIKDSDGNKVANPERDAKIMDEIYGLLLDEVDQKDTELKLKEGVVDSNDLLFYCYYATFEKDGATVVVYPSKMKESSATSVELFQSELSDVADGVRDAVLALGEVDIKDYIYSTTTSGKVTAGDKIAYVSYKVEEDGTQTEYKYTTVNLNDSENEIVKNLLAKEATVGTAVEFTITEGEGESATTLRTYTEVKVQWVVDSGKEVTFDYTTESESTTTDVAKGANVTIPKDTKLTYHVYPAYYFEVAEFSAEEVLETLIESLSKDSLDCLADCEELIKVYNEKVTALDEAEKALEDAEKELEDAEAALEKVDKNNADLLATANQAVETAKGKITEKIKLVGTAKTNKDNAMKDIFVKVGGGSEVETAETDGKTKIMNEYKETVKDDLVEEYNAEIKENLAAAIWKLMKEKATVTGCPDKGVDEVYDRMYESHEYTFYTGTDSTTSESHYSIYKGNFKEYLKTKMGTDSFSAAKEALREEAEEYVADIVIIYYIAEQYGVKLTEDEIKEYKDDENGNYSYNEYYQGETNALAAYQFDKLMNHFLDSETDEETGDVTYKNIVFTTEEHEH